MPTGMTPLDMSSMLCLVAASKAPSTHIKYLRYWNRWKQWAINFNGSAPLPANPSVFAIYISRLVNQTNSKSIVDATLAAVSYYHSAAGLVSPTLNPLVKLVAEGARRICAKPVVKKQPVTVDMIYKFHDVIRIPSCSLVEHRTLFAVTVMFAGFLRWSDIVNLKRKHFAFHSEGMVITIEYSKTDQYWEGDKVFIARVQEVICPVNVAEFYFARLNLDLESYVVCRMPKNIPYGGYPLSDTSMRQYFNKLCTMIGVEAKDFGLHSLRIGAVSEAYDKGVKHKVLMRHGRWRSAETMEKYKKLSSKKKYSASKVLFSL